MEEVRILISCHRSWLRQTLPKLGVDPESELAADIELCLGEAVGNCQRHNEEESVVIRIQRDECGISVQVISFSHNERFDRIEERIAHAYDCGMPCGKDLSKIGSRGLPTICALSSRVEIFRSCHGYPGMGVLLMNFAPCASEFPEHNPARGFSFVLHNWQNC